MTQFLASAVAGVIYGAVLAVASLGFTVQFGVTNYFNFAYGEIMAIGAMVAATFNSLAFHWSIWIAGLLGCVAAALVAAFLDFVILTPFLRKYRHVWTMLLVTFAIALLLDNVFLLTWGSGYTQYNHVTGPLLHLGGVRITMAQIVYLLLALLCLVAMYVVLKRTRLGRSMRALSDDETLAAITGLNTRRITTVTWLISGGLAGISGVLLGLQTHTFNASVGVNYEYYIFIAVILGGIGEPVGAVLGGLVVGVVTQIAAIAVPSGLSPVIAFTILVLVLFVRPMGLLGVPGRLDRLTA